MFSVIKMVLNLQNVLGESDQSNILTNPICPIFHNAPFVTEMYAHLCYKMVYCGIWESGLYHANWQPGSWFNIKMSSYQYGKSHCGDKMIVRSFYLHNGKSYTDRMASHYILNQPPGFYMILVITCHCNAYVIRMDPERERLSEDLRHLNGTE